MDDAPAALAGPFARRRVFLLVRSTRTARRLVQAGVPVPVINIGGLHHHPGSRSILPFVFLDDSEVADLKWLAERGTRLSAQDLPGNKAFDLTPLLDRGDLERSHVSLRHPQPSTGRQLRFGHRGCLP